MSLLQFNAVVKKSIIFKDPVQQCSIFGRSGHITFPADVNHKKRIFSSFAHQILEKMKGT